MKLYEVTTIKLKANGEYGDEYQSYQGFDFDEAQKSKQKAIDDYDRLTEHDKLQTVIEGRVWDIDDSTDINDPDEVIEAMCNSGCYDLF